MGFISEAKLAELLDLSAQTIAKWRKASKGPKYTRVGGTIRYSDEDVTAFIEAGTVDPQGSEADDE